MVATITAFAALLGAAVAQQADKKTTETYHKMIHQGVPTGQLSEIKRFYVQNGKVIPNSESTISGNPGNSITSEFCAAQNVAFNDNDIFAEKGGMAQFSKAIEKPMVLVMSLWDNHYSNMLWLDSTFPTDADAEEAGKGRGSCGTDSGVPQQVESAQSSDNVTYSNIKFGPVGSIFKQ